MIGLNDWEGLYIDGRLFDEYHRLDTAWVVSVYDMARFMGFSGVSFRTTFYDHEEDHPLHKYEPLHYMPTKLTEADFDALWERADDVKLRERAFRALTTFINEDLS